MQFEHVEFEVEGNVGVITLNRPQAANAQSAKVLRELDEAWDAADENTEVKVIVFKSNGKHFSAGHDMSGSDNDNETDMSVFDTPPCRASASPPASCSAGRAT
jgi:enoyl-CoA hydratase/carnithine racemase